ncbi:MAG: hypothetical protein IKQ59_07555 [Prevotella sp.]|nr:hypothetical protein [Prevotella sp.]
MSYDIAIIDHHPRFNNCKEFLAWYDEAIGHQQYDYRQARPALQQWFLKMKDRVRPLNGEFAPAADEIDSGEFPEADYSFGKDFIYVALAHIDAEKTSTLAFELAKECRLTYFDISGTGELHNADGSHFQVSHQETVDKGGSKQKEKPQSHFPLKKVEIISLLLVVASIVGWIITFQMEIGDARKWMSILSLGLVAMSIDPTFSLQRKSSGTKDTNRVGRAVCYLFAVAAAVFMLFMLLAAPFISEVSIGGYILILVFFIFFLIVVLRSLFSAHGWLSRRLRWLKGKKQLTITSEEKVLYSDDDEKGISYAYRPAERLFFVNRTMYLNPTRLEKEYSERKHQLQVRMEQTNIPLKWEISECDGSLSFRTSVGLLKKDATKENVCRIRDVMRDLAKEDFDQHLFSKHVFDNDTVYMDSYHYRIIRMVFVGADNTFERYCPQDASDDAYERLDEKYWAMYDEARMTNIKPADLIEADEFERIWKKKA